MNNSKITPATGEGMKKYDWLLTQLIRKVRMNHSQNQKRALGKSTGPTVIHVQSTATPNTLLPSSLRSLHFTADYILYNCVCDEYKSWIVISCGASPDLRFVIHFNLFDFRIFWFSHPLALISRRGSWRVRPRWARLLDQQQWFTQGMKGLCEHVRPLKEPAFVLFT